MEQITKPNLETCAIQEACDYSVAMIVKQGERCMKHPIEGERSQSFCAYGNKEGNHCAVGWLLDDTNEDLMSYEGDVGDLVRQFEHTVPAILSKDLDIFENLQSFHDLVEYDNKVKYLERLSAYIDTDKPQYKQWLEMGD